MSSVQDGTRQENRRDSRPRHRARKGESETERSVCPVKESVMVSYHLQKNDSLTDQLWATESEAPREDHCPGSWTIICPPGLDEARLGWQRASSELFIAAPSQQKRD